MPLIKEERVIVTFAGTAHAMHMEQLAKASGIPGRMIPVPRQITAGCGLAWSAPPEAEETIREWIKEKELEIESICRLVI